MGTNYYWESDPCPTCARHDSLHIGLASQGWCFYLHVYPDGYEPKNLADWVKKFSTGVIVDEYGNDITPEKMLDIITN